MSKTGPQAQDTGRVALAYARSLLDYLRAHGPQPAQLFDPRQVAEIESGDPRTRMPLADWVAMFERAIEATGDPALPLKVGEAIKPRHYGLLGYVAMNCATLGEAIAQLERYELLVGEISRSQLLRAGDKAELYWRWPHGGAAPPALAQSSLAGWITYARWLTDRPDLAGEAHFQFPAPRELAPYRRMANGSPLHFGAEHTKLVFPAAYLDLPIVQADPAMRAVVEAQAATLMRELSGEPEFLREVKMLVGRNLVHGRVTLEDSAQALGINARTLQRRLVALDSSYQELLDSVRRAHAEQHLRDESVSLAEVAFLLGYSEQSAFQRAFKRWSGITPAEFRRSSSSS